MNMSMQKENARMQFIDIAKGIAIICIILGHIGNPTINRIVFTFHVPIFFLITGYFINTKREMLDFIKIKFRTLIVPYIVTCIVIVIIGVWRDRVSIDVISSLKT